MTQPHVTSQPFPIEAIATYPLPGMAIPGEIAWSPDDRLVTFLWSPERTLARQLYAFDPETGDRWLVATPIGEGTTDENVSLEEALRRERLRQRETGITRYDWADEAERLLVPLQSGLYVQDGADAPLRLLVSADEHPVLDPQLSPDGALVAYVQDAELHVVPAEGGEPRQITAGARGTGKTHGLAEYVAQEEMHRREGFWWSQDSRLLAFAEVDETHIPPFRIMHLGKDAVGEEAQEDHRFPFAGAENARVRLAVVPARGGEPRWMDLGDDEDIYLARADWFPDGSLVVQVQDRRQQQLELLRFDPDTGERTRLLRETSDVWINLHDLLKPLEGGRFVWGSERSGFQHLYLYEADGTLVRPLTSGEWMVTGLAGVDEGRGLLYFTGTRESPLETHLYVVPLGGGEPRRLTEAPGTHNVVLDHARRRFVDTYHALDAPPTVTLRSLDDGRRLATIFDERDPRLDALRLRAPEIVSFQNRAGETLFGMLYRPPAEQGEGPFPTLVRVYGGPHVQLVADSWLPTVDMRAQYLSSLGFLVFTVDNRGSARRGLAFEGAIRHRIGHAEVDDQVDGVRWLAEQGLADPARVGVYGWSYGGYMTLMCLLRAPETFQVGVAGAPVTHMDGYDTHYTERYLGLPQENPEGYHASSVMAHVDGLRGKLLLVHGLIDENVHFRHTARLINALNRARKPYDLLLFPDERHMPRRLEDRIYLEERVRDYFLEHLKLSRRVTEPQP